MAGSSYAMLAREKKALAIAQILEHCGATSGEAADASEEERTMAARAANVKQPSDETWAMVVQMMRSREPREEGE